MHITISINRLRIQARHGVYDQERIVGHAFEVSAHLRYPAEGAVTDDDLASTLNYAEVVEVIRHEMATPSALLEHAASRIREALLERFPAIEGGSLTIAKLSPPIEAQMDSVAVTLEW